MALRHTIIIILSRIEQLEGTTAAGDLGTLKQAAIDADLAVQAGAPNSAKLEEALYNVQEWLGHCVANCADHINDLAT